MKQNKLIALAMLLPMIFCFIFFIGLYFYPFYSRKIEPYPPIKFFDVLNQEIGKGNYIKKYSLDKGFMASYNVIVKQKSINNFEKFLLQNHWIDMGVNERSQNIYCLDPNNSITIWSEDSETWIGYLYDKKGNLFCKNFKFK